MYIKLSTTSLGAAKVYDKLGNMVAEGTDYINIEALNSGCYMVKEGNRFTKIIKN